MLCFSIDSLLNAELNVTSLHVFIRLFHVNKSERKNPLVTRIFLEYRKCSNSAHKCFLRPNFHSFMAIFSITVDRDEVAGLGSDTQHPGV